MLKYTIEREYTRYNLFKEIESVMGMLLERDLSYSLPRMHRVRQLFAADEIEDVQRAALAQLSRADIREKVRPGMRVAVAVGSRGIANIGIGVVLAAKTLTRYPRLQNDPDFCEYYLIGTLSSLLLAIGAALLFFPPDELILLLSPSC